MKGGGLNFLVESDIQEKCEVQNFGQEWGQPSPFPPLAANSDPPIKNTLRSVLGLTTVIILKRVRWKRGGKIFDGVQSTQHNPFISM